MDRVTQKGNRGWWSYMQLLQDSRGERCRSLGTGEGLGSRYSRRHLVQRSLLYNRDPPVRRGPPGAESGEVPLSAVLKQRPPWGRSRGAPGLGRETLWCQA